MNDRSLRARAASWQFIEFDITPMILSMSTLGILGSLAAMFVVEKAVGMAPLVGLPQH
jgi:hypothetical protein